MKKNQPKLKSQFPATMSLVSSQMLGAGETSRRTARSCEVTGPDSRDIECHHHHKPCCETQCKQHFRTAARDCFLSPSTMKGIFTESGPAPCGNGALVPLGSSYCQAYFNVFKLAYIMMGFIIISSYMWIIYSYITLCCSSSLRSHFPNRPLLYLCLICVHYFSLVSPYTRKHDISLRVWLILLTC